MIKRTPLEISTGVDIDYAPERRDNVITITTFLGVNDEGHVQHFGLLELLDELVESYTVGPKDRMLNSAGKLPQKFPTEDDRSMVLNAARSFREAADVLERLAGHIETLKR